MAFDLTKGRDTSAALAHALLEKRKQKETPVTFGYGNGTPQRFADVGTAEELGLIGGAFGGPLNDKKHPDHKAATDYARKAFDIMSTSPLMTGFSEYFAGETPQGEQAKDPVKEVA